MSELWIVGAGGHGVVVADAARAAGRWSRIVFFDDRWPAVTAVADWPVEGTVASLRDRVVRTQGAELVIALGDNRRRLSLGRELASEGARLATVIHPFSAISPLASIGAGSVAMAGTVVNARARLGEAVIVNTGASVDHDCQIGDGVHLCPGSRLAGNVTVQDLAWFGIGAAAIQGVTIGAASTVGASATVIRDVRESATVAGNPAKEIQRDS